MMLGYEPMLDNFHFLRIISSDSFHLYVKTDSIIDFTKNRLLTRIILGIKSFPRKRKLVIRLDGSHQFKNNWFSWSIFTS